MASTSETGYAITVGNLKNLISFCKGYGAAYNPGNGMLQISSLEDLLSESQDALRQVINTKNDLNLAINERQVVFGQLNFGNKDTGLTAR